jgi:hypothetical protein
MTEKLIKSENLENGIKLDIFDACRPLIGDRWQITLIARATVSVKAAMSDDKEGEGDADAICKALGDEVVFEQKRERNFIDDAEKDALFQSLFDLFQESTRKYVAHPDFPRKLVAKEYRTFLAKPQRYGLKKKGSGK